MVAHPSIDPTDFLHEHLAQASPDLLRSLLSSMIDTLMSAEADAICGAAHGERSAQRVNQRNGYRHRDFDTRAGTLDVAIPKLRSGSYFPDWLLERRRRAEAALTSDRPSCSTANNAGHKPGGCSTTTPSNSTTASPGCWCCSTPSAPPRSPS